MSRRRSISFGLLLASAAVLLRAQVPDIGVPPTAPVPVPQPWRNPSVLQADNNWLDVSSRAAVRDSWNLTFQPTTNVPSGWTGDVDANFPGTTTQAFKDVVAARINWFRAMAGVPPSITIDPVFSAKDQQAALMFSANRQITHTPPETWRDYSAEGAEAAGNSNICIGYSGDPGCLVAYIIDYGSNNAAVGHRRWVLYPQTLRMGTGDVPASGPGANPYPPANALWVFDGNYGAYRPATRDTFVSWPPPGYVPYQVAGPRWSFSYPNADFSQAAVSMLRGGASVPVRLEPLSNGYGENTLVWVPDNLDPSRYPQLLPPAADTVYNATLSNVLVAGVPRTFSYSVTVFDPDTVPEATFEFVPPSSTISSAAASGTVNLLVFPANTSWSASSSAAWLSVTSAMSGTGGAAIAWSASPNASSLSRSATVRASGAVFTLIQAGAACSFTHSASSAVLPAAGGSGSFTVTAEPADCDFGQYSWTGFISVTASRAGAVLTMNFTAGVNNSNADRVSSIMVAGRTFAITQRSAGAPQIAADFNSDGITDVIWQDPISGWAQVWYLGGSQGVTTTGAANLTARNTWRIVGMADFDRDGHPDVAWQDPVTGAAQLWLMGGPGGNVVQSATTLSGPNAWRIMSIADFNGDGIPDCIWQDQVSGWAQIWFMGGPQGTTLTGAVNLTARNTWRIAGTGDFNSDGVPDVVWQDPVTGAVQIWYLGGPQGNVVQNAVNLVDSNAWRLAAIGDFNDDGHPDVVWQDPVSGAAQAWFLSGAQGTTVIGSASMGSGNSWRIMGPH